MGPASPPAQQLPDLPPRRAGDLWPPSILFLRSSVPLRVTARSARVVFDVLPGWLCSDGGGDAAVVVGPPAGPGRHGARPPPGLRRPRPLRRRMPAVARRSASPPTAPAVAAPRVPGRHLLQPPLRQAVPFPGLWLCRLQGRRRWQLARLPARRRLFLGQPLLQGHREAPCSGSHQAPAPNAAVKHAELEKQTVIIGCTWLDLKFSEKNAIVNKLLVCSPNLVAAFFGSKRIKGDGHTSQILVCQPGASSWSVRALDQCKGFEDMAFYQGKLYAIAVDENLLVVDISQDPNTGDPQVARIGQVIKGDPNPLLDAWWPDNTTGSKKLYLVESCGVLLMVRRTVCCRISEEDERIVAEQNKFEVFKADIQHSRWVNVTTLGDDQVLFLGLQCSRAVSASRYGVSGDQIFFLDDEAESAKQYYFDEENTSVGLYDIRTGEVSSPLPMVWKHGVLLVTWLFP